MKLLIKIATTLLIVVFIALMIAPPLVERSKNKVHPHVPWPVSSQAQTFHDTLIIGDWHSDSTLWNRDLLQQSNDGHMDIPRLQQGNVAIQMFTTTTKSPSGQNYASNTGDSRDNITLLSIIQRWPTKTWQNLTQRALYQAKRLKGFAAKSSQQFRIITNQQELQQLLSDRKNNKQLVGGLLGTEGSHALEGKIKSIDLLYDAGFRMMSLHHFFDNKLGGSLHGAKKLGLSGFGREVVKKINQKSIILDLSHSSESVVQDVLSMSTRPVIISHTGLKGFCNSHRNISDALMKIIAKKGGLIALGYWQAAACDTSPIQIAKHIAYGIALVGANHISLGSDFDGAVTTGFDVSELAAITHALLTLNVSKTDIKKVMGENMINFLAMQLPEK